MAGVFSSTTKLMLKNVIRHTNSHNKTVEEADMWQQYERMKETDGLKSSNPSYGHDDRCEPRGKIQDWGDYSWSSRPRKGKKAVNSYYSKRAHMDKEEEKQGGSLGTSSTYWTRQLQKLESSDPNRWDHSGYRELYPEDFRSDRSDACSSESSAHHHRRKKKLSTRKKKKHHKKRKHKKKEKSSHKHRKQSRKRLCSDSADSDLDPHFSAPDTVDCWLSKSRPTDKKHSRKLSSNCSSFSESDSDAESCDRKQFSEKGTVKRTRKYSASSDSLSSPDKRKVENYTESQRKKFKKHKNRNKRFATSRTFSKQEKDGLVVDMCKEVSGHAGSGTVDRSLQKGVPHHNHSLKQRYVEDRKREGRERHKDTEVYDTHSHRKRRKYSYSLSSSSDRD